MQAWMGRPDARWLFLPFEAIQLLAVPPTSSVLPGGTKGSIGQWTSSQNHTRPLDESTPRPNEPARPQFQDRFIADPAIAIPSSRVKSQDTGGPRGGLTRVVGSL